jgi:hypothetical protein
LGGPTLDERLHALGRIRCAEQADHLGPEAVDGRRLVVLDHGEVTNGLVCDVVEV